MLCWRRRADLAQLQLVQREASVKPYGAKDVSCLSTVNIFPRVPATAATRSGLLKYHSIGAFKASMKLRSGLPNECKEKKPCLNAKSIQRKTKWAKNSAARIQAVSDTSRARPVPSMSAA